jgi:hypothetical protein
MFRNSGKVSATYTCFNVLPHLALPVILLEQFMSLKLLLIFVCAAALFFFLRSISASSADWFGQNTSRHYRNPGRDPRVHWVSPANGTPAPVANDLGRVRVTRLNFSQFDAVPGPPDPECFIDELFVELLDPREDYRWTVTFVVATPAGIRKLMDDERWSFFYSTEIFVVRRYDFLTIRQAVFGRIKELHEDVGLSNGSTRPPVVG